MNRYFANAEQCGTWFEKTGYQYCEDDNSHIPYVYNEQAWACRLQNDWQIRQALDAYAEEDRRWAQGDRLIEEMFNS